MEQQQTVPDFVTPFMRTIAARFLFYWAEEDELCPISFSDETFTMNEGEEDESEERVQDITIDTEDGWTRSITDEHLFYDPADAEKIADELRRERKWLVKVYPVRHGDDFGIGCSIERNPILVNRLGYGIFVRKELPDYAKHYRKVRNIDTTKITSKAEGLLYWVELSAGDYLQKTKLPFQETCFGVEANLPFPCSQRIITKAFIRESDARAFFKATGIRMMDAWTRAKSL